MTRRRETSPTLHALLAACGGFLVGVLWFDLMFDVQVRGHDPGPLPDPVVASIASYYRRVTTEAHPMQRLIAAVMATTVLGAVWALRGRTHRALRWLALATGAGPIALAAIRVFPDAVALGSRAGTLAEQSALARAIFAAHVACLVSVAAFTIVQVALARGPRRSAD